MADGEVFIARQDEGETPGSGGHLSHNLWNVVTIEMGAGTAIPSVRHYSEQTSKKFGASVVRINPREFDVPNQRDVGIPIGSLAALRGIDEALNGLPPVMNLDFTQYPQNEPL